MILYLRKKQDINKIEFRYSDLKYSYESFNEKFKTNFIFRPDIITINNFLKIKIFKHSPINKVLLGKNGWLFYAHENEYYNVIDYYRSINPFNVEELEYWKNRLESRYYWLKKQGIEYLFIVAPNKSTIYNNFLPDHINKTKQKNRFDQLIYYLNNNESPVKILDLRKELFEKKKLSKLYRLTDSHWSHYGAFYAYKSIMRYLRTKNINSFKTNIQNYNIEKKLNYFGGDLAQLLSLGNEYRETITILKFKESKNILNMKLKNFKKPFVEVSVKESKKGDIGSAIFVHDSIGYRLIPFLTQHFKRIIYIRDWNLNFYKNLIKKEKPVIVIEEMAERFFMHNRLAPTYEN